MPFIIMGVKVANTSPKVFSPFVVAIFEVVWHWGNFPLFNGTKGLAGIWFRGEGKIDADFW